MKLNTGLMAFTFISSSFWFSAADSSASQKHKKRVHLRGRVANSMSDNTVPVQPHSAAAADANTDIGRYPWGLAQVDGISTHNGGGSGGVVVVEDEPLGSAYLTLSEGDDFFHPGPNIEDDYLGLGLRLFPDPSLNPTWSNGPN